MHMLELFAFLICEVYFKEGTEVATNEVWAFWIELGNPNPSPWQMVSFTSRTNFCAAPIIGTGPVGRTAMCPLSIFTLDLLRAGKASRCATKQAPMKQGPRVASSFADSLPAA